MASMDRNRSITGNFQHIAFVFLYLVLVAANGKLFTIKSINGTELFYLEEAQRLCAIEGSRLATPEELRQAVLECSFTVCTKGWLANGVVGTILCSTMESVHESRIKVVDVKVDRPITEEEQFNAFCVKDEDETETFIDYEDNLNDDKDVPDFESYNEEEDYDDGYNEQHELSLNIHNEQNAHLEDARDPTSIEKANKRPTEAPFSLSQTHLFWFSPEVISGIKSEMEQHDITKTHLNNIKYMGIQTDNHDHVNSQHMTYKDHPMYTSEKKNNTKANKNVSENTNSSFLNGYTTRVTTQSIDGSVETEDISLVTFKTVLSNIDSTALSANTDLNGVATAFPTPTTLGNSQAVVQPESTIVPENRNSDEVNNDSSSMGYHTSNLKFIDDESMLPTVHDASESIPTVDYHKVNVDSTILLANIYDLLIQSTPSEIEFTVGQNSKTFEEDISEGKQMVSTVQPCLGDECLQVSKGQLIAIIVVIICLLLLLTIMAVWCYKKQHKSSVYNLNGNRHLQHIEM
ncbi:sushi domain-containing protein 5 isoform X2 [Pelobates fuscus]|uniref:sushi domain-containing protein 5 isoform X2 n=1 Tax=Pelobates fuscus TaxID=191477 RepID=UPI002FE450FC